MSETIESPDAQKTFLLFLGMGGITIVLLIAVAAAFINAPNRNGTVVLPGGVTYLGQSQKTDTPTPTPANSTIFTISPQTPWVTFTGSPFGFTFSHPKTLPLVVFPTDPSGSIAINWGPGDPNSKILASVINLSGDPQLSKFADRPTREFVAGYWRQFAGLSGIASEAAFTNAKQLTGYRALYINNEGQTPNVDVFFPSPKNKNLILRIANGIVDPNIFERIVDSVEWK